MQVINAPISTVVIIFRIIVKHDYNRKQAGRAPATLNEKINDSTSSLAQGPVTEIFRYYTHAVDATAGVPYS